MLFIDMVNIYANSKIENVIVVIGLVTQNVDCIIRYSKTGNVITSLFYFEMAFFMHLTLFEILAFFLTLFRIIKNK